MYLLTDGKNYVKRNPVDNTKYISTSSPVLATQFSYKEARSLLQNKKAAIRWIKSYHMIEADTGNSVDCNVSYNGKADIHINDDFNEDVLSDIMSEKNKILGLAGWNLTQLETYNAILNHNISYCDSALSDIRHAIDEAEKIPAHTRAKIMGLEKDVLGKRAKSKECKRYVDVLITAVKNNYTIEKIKLEIAKVEPEQYKGRTKYYGIIKAMWTDK